MVLLIKEELKSYQDAKVSYICGKRMLKFTYDKNYQKSETTVIIQGNIQAHPLVFII